MDFWISHGFQDFGLDFWISGWISMTVYEISRVSDPSIQTTLFAPSRKNPVDTPPVVISGALFVWETTRGSLW